MTTSFKGYMTPASLIEIKSEIADRLRSKKKECLFYKGQIVDVKRVKITIRVQK